MGWGGVGGGQRGLRRTCSQARGAGPAGLLSASEAPLPAGRAGSIPALGMGHPSAHVGHDLRQRVEGKVEPSVGTKAGALQSVAPVGVRGGGGGGGVAGLL